MTEDEAKTYVEQTFPTGSIIAFQHWVLRDKRQNSLPHTVFAATSVINYDIMVFALDFTMDFVRSVVQFHREYREATADD